MAVAQPPPAPVAPGSTPAPPAKKSGCAGCGFGCLGCLGVAVVLVLLLVGGAWYFLVAQVRAGVPAPAALVVFNAPVDVGHNDSGYRAAIPGEPLTAGSSVRTGNGGRAAIQFPDGSFIRMAPSTTVTVTAAQLNKDGTLQSASVTQRVGRTLTNVQHLVSGASFHVGGHSVTAEVRGTQFEVLVRVNGTNLIIVFDGSVIVVGTTTITVNAGQEVDVGANGTLGNPRAIQSDAQDPYLPSVQCSRAIATGTAPGTVQNTTGDAIATGQTAEQDYNSAGGNLTVVMCYPGSLMSVAVTDPTGAQHAAQGKSPVFVRIPNGPPGLYKAVVRGIDVPSGGEPYAVSFGTDEACAEGDIDTGGVVRRTFSNAQIAQALTSSGASGVTLEVQGNSPDSARIYYYSDFGGNKLSWIIDFYAASPNLGFVLTEFKVGEISIVTGIVQRLPAASGQSGVAIDFNVDRVFSCTGSGGGMMVVEGHR